MKSLYLIFPFLIALTFVSCNSTAISYTNIDCATVFINGPSSLSPGETAVLNAVFYDKENKIIKNCKGISPVWNIGSQDVIKIEKDLGNCIKVKALRKGECCVQASVNNAVTSMIIEVK
ncbi:TPA: hypothetical protein DCW38_06580 [candidate division WOR-3 bacterium]|jgi:hypothetical protein|uniref:BIG2 domain-containing protein n=1 Tax=candidate division WOR-3 bacterium TaxID=2052148 RepID=A0A350HBB3_UNCW3|nr:hypothetical protein [candidate division WOR-3 bacterium]